MQGEIEEIIKATASYIIKKQDNAAGINDWEVNIKIGMNTKIIGYLFINKHKILEKKNFSKYFTREDILELYNDLTEKKESKNKKNSLNDYNFDNLLLILYRYAVALKLI